MSDIGAQSNVYQRLRSYGELVDDVLLNVRNRGISTVDERRRQLALLLIATTESGARPVEAGWFATLLTAHELQAINWHQVGEQLLQPGYESQIEPSLEQLARALEGRRSDTLDRIRRPMR